MLHYSLSYMVLDVIQNIMTVTKSVSQSAQMNITGYTCDVDILSVDA